MIGTEGEKWAPASGDYIDLSTRPVAKAESMKSLFL